MRSPTTDDRYPWLNSRLPLKIRTSGRRQNRLQATRRSILYRPTISPNILITRISCRFTACILVLSGPEDVACFGRGRVLVPRVTPLENSEMKNRRVKAWACGSLVLGLTSTAFAQTPQYPGKVLPPIGSPQVPGKVLPPVGPPITTPQVPGKGMPFPGPGPIGTPQVPGKGMPLPGPGPIGTPQVPGKGMPFPGPGPIGTPQVPGKVLPPVGPPIGSPQLPGKSPVAGAPVQFVPAAPTVAPAGGAPAVDEPPPAPAPPAP